MICYEVLDSMATVVHSPKHLLIMGRVHIIQLCYNVLFNDVLHVWEDSGLILPLIFHKATHYFNNGI